MESKFALFFYYIPPKGKCNLEEKERWMITFAVAPILKVSTGKNLKVKKIVIGHYKSTKFLITYKIFTPLF